MSGEYFHFLIFTSPLRLSHELRTPLTPALLVTDQAQYDTTLPDSVREDMAMVTRQIRLQVQLVDDLLDVTKIRQGKLQLHMQELDAHALLRHTLNLLTHSATEKTISIELHDTVPPHLSPAAASRARHRLEGAAVVRADPTRLQQIFWNLIGNAIKFTPQGGAVSIHAWTAAASSPDTNRHSTTGDTIDSTGSAPKRKRKAPADAELNSSTSHSTASFLHVSVSDTGVGIAPEVIIALTFFFLFTFIALVLNDIKMRNDLVTVTKHYRSICVHLFCSELNERLLVGMTQMYVFFLYIVQKRLC